MYFYERGFKLRFVILALSNLASIATIILSRSIQGFLVYATTISVALIICVRRKSRKISIIFTALYAIVGIFIGTTLFGVGLLGNLLSSQTFSIRLAYWRAAIRMILERPITGVGMDGFGSFYRQYRDDLGIQISSGQLTDSPHNVFLDLFSSGGIPLGVLHILIFLVPCFVWLVRIYRGHNPNFILSLVLAIHFGFIVQSLVSPFQIGIVIWGWLSSAVLMTSRNDVIESPQLHQDKKNLGVSKIFAFSKVAMLGSVFFIALAPLVADARFLSALNSKSGAQVFQVATAWPHDSRRFVIAVQAFAGNGYGDIALELAKLGVSYNPRLYEMWNEILINEKSTAKMKSEARVRLKQLDPTFIENP